MSFTRLVAADESLNHQVVDTFASPGQSDPAWTEKIWAAAHVLKSGHQIGFGLGKYTNRGVMDAFAGITHGDNQRVVRASRELGDDPDSSDVGPIRYEVVEPMRAIRFVLDPAADREFAFDVTMHSDVPPQLEARWPFLRHDTYGVGNDVLRYHQIGTATGWLRYGGDHVELDEAGCPAFRDHSWGIKPGVGLPRPDAAPARTPRSRYRIWAPMHMTRPDRSTYGLFVSYLCEIAADGSVDVRTEAAVEQADGVRVGCSTVVPRLQVDPASRDLLGGTIDLVDMHERRRTLRLTRATDTAFYISAGGYYGGFDGHALGQWHGTQWHDTIELVGTNEPATRSRLHQNKDVLFRVDDDTTGDSGYANIECIVTGELSPLPLPTVQT